MHVRRNKVQFLISMLSRTEFHCARELYCAQPDRALQLIASPAHRKHAQKKNTRATRKSSTLMMLMYSISGCRYASLTLAISSFASADCEPHTKCDDPANTDEVEREAAVRNKNRTRAMRG